MTENRKIASLTPIWISSGLMPCEPGNYSVECGFSGWGGGYWGGNGWGMDPNPGQRIIREAEQAWDITLWRYHSWGREGFSRNWISDFDSAPQGWHAGVHWTKCPPVRFLISGIGPDQAPDKTAISQQQRADIPNGGVAIKPKNFGVKGINGNNRNVFLNMRFEVDWSTATPTGIPTGIPTEGPFSPVDNIGPASVRNSPGNQIDVYNYQKYGDALASSRTAMVTTWIPSNTAGVKCPE